MTVANRCLDIYNSGTANGTPVGVWGCHGAANQQCVSRPDGTLVNPMSDRCLDAGIESQVLLLYDCHAEPWQRWALPAGD
ncbi:hypothetical protein BS329_20900 [Amycolatopsis coloradensis]|uniref:Ricin B lectin domain-containing protein n=1 Tax=Amycolatopsis coloradensis TaxID=76021 RepID=A0A1R0KQW9_9PSEU|nr:hypothetical protein BS329_20900 [Amycolatopsis coloradensis]